MLLNLLLEDLIMNKAIIKAVQDLEAKLLAGVISEQFYQKELDNLLSIVEDDIDTANYIRLHKDRDI